MRLQRGQASQDFGGVDAALAAIATLVASWPISTLMAEPTWLGGTVLLLAVVSLTGVGARALAVRGWRVLLVQVVCSVLAAGAIYGRGHLWHGLPTFETLDFAGRLVRDAVATAQAYAAPAPTTPGLSFVVGCGLALTALAVDYLAVTRRSPALAGLPLLAAFLASAANRGSSLPVHFFLAAAAMWLVLVARAGSAVLRGWGTTTATVARTPASWSMAYSGVSRYSSMARMLGATALVAAVAVPVIIPANAPQFLASGLGRSSLFGGRSDVVGISLSLDLAADLANRSTAPVLQYTTTDTSPPPLRVSVSDFYRSENGVWLPWGRPLPALFPNPDVPDPAGLTAEVPRKTFSMTVRRNLLDSPNLAAPYPLIDADLAGISWGADLETQSVRVAQRPDSYTASYWRLEPPATMLRDAPSLSASERDFFARDLTVDGPFDGQVAAVAELATAGKTLAYDKALAIQQYLRASGGFTYSLTLAPPAKDQFGKDAGFDPLTNFLVTKQGYCVQFASAMAMMSRAVGIPARVAIGFLPGTQAKGGVWSVTASDAHAWPELYLSGIGWTRFEPTPSRAAPPLYAIPATSPEASVNGLPAGGATAPAPRTTARKDLGDPAVDKATSQGGGWSLSSAWRWLTHGWGLVLLSLLIGLSGSLVVPSAALWRRRRILRTARSPAQRVEVQWELLTSSLGDLGIAPAPSRTPRQQRTYYEKQGSLEGASSQALSRVVQTLELSRYAVSPPDASGLSVDARQVFRAVAASRGGRERLRAALWPSSGIAQLRAATAELTARIRVPVRDACNVVRQRLHARR